MMLKKGFWMMSAAAALLFAAGCSELPVETSSVPSEASAWEGSSESSRGNSAFSLPGESTETDSSESSVVIPSAEFSAYRGEEEPYIEEIRLSEIVEEGFSFGSTDLTLGLGRSTTITYEFSPLGVTDRTLSWSTSDASVVTVKDGKLTAVGIGRATVRAKTAAGRVAECRVTVIEKTALSAVASLIENLTDGSPAGWQFALYDLDADGTKELLTRRLNGERREVMVFRISDGEQLLSLETGDNEEWATWQRQDGSRYVLLSFSQTMTGGGTRSVMDEILCSEEGTLQSRRVLAREVSLSGESSFYSFVDGALVSCDAEGYQLVRNAYFSNNKQLPNTVLQWVTGKDAETIAGALE